MASRNVVYKVGRNREAGAEVYVIDNRNRKAFPKIESKWVTECMTHREACGHETRMLAEQRAHHPTQWCDACREAGTSRSQSHKPTTSKGATLEFDRRVYRYVLLNWAVSANDILTGDILADVPGHPKADLKMINASLKRLQKKHLVESERINMEQTLTWQTYFDVDNDPDAETNGEAAFQAAYGVAS